MALKFAGGAFGDARNSDVARQKRRLLPHGGRHHGLRREPSRAGWGIRRSLEPFAPPRDGPRTHRRTVSPRRRALDRSKSSSAHARRGRGSPSRTWRGHPEQTLRRVMVSRRAIARVDPRLERGAWRACGRRKLGGRDDFHPVAGGHIKAGGHGANPHSHCSIPGSGSGIRSAAGRLGPRARTRAAYAGIEAGKPCGDAADLYYASTFHIPGTLDAGFYTRCFRGDPTFSCADRPASTPPDVRTDRRAQRKAVSRMLFPTVAAAATFRRPAKGSQSGDHNVQLIGATHVANVARLMRDDSIMPPA